MMRDLPPQTQADRRHAQRKKLHGPILGSVADQVVVNDIPGERAPMEAWKRWFADRCGITGSTEALSDPDFERFVWTVEVYSVEVLRARIPEQGA